jgi:hypothetical protein
MPGIIGVFPLIPRWAECDQLLAAFVPHFLVQVDLKSPGKGPKLATEMFWTILTQNGSSFLLPHFFTASITTWRR